MKKQPECPEEISISTSLRYVDTRHVLVYTHKQHIILVVPEDKMWLTPDGADKLAAALKATAQRQREMDAWAIKHRPQSYEGKQARRRRRRK
jgi:hypothetical protein